MSNDQEWARQYPELAAQLRKITDDGAARNAPDAPDKAEGLAEPRDLITSDLAYIVGGTGGWFVIAGVLVKEVVRPALMATVVARHARRADELAAVLEAALEREQTCEAHPDTVLALRTVAQALGEQCGVLDEVADHLAGRCRR